MTYDGPLGRLPAELYDLILDHYHTFDEESWRNKDVRVWGSVCRAFRNGIRPRTSHVVKMGSLHPDGSEVSEICYFHRMMTGPSEALVDPSLTRQLITADFRMRLIWEPYGNVIHSYHLIEYTLSEFESLLPSEMPSDGYKVEASNESLLPPEMPSDDYKVEMSIKAAIKLLYEALAGMVNLSDVYWELSIPLTDAFEGIMPHRHEITTSKTIAGLFVRCKNLRKIVYADFLVTDTRPLRFMSRLEHLELRSREVGGPYMASGSEVDRLSEEEREQYRIVAEAEEEDVDWNLHAFLQQAPSFKRLVTNWYNPLALPANLPFWAVVDVEMVDWETRQEQDIHKENGPTEILLAKAVLALKPALVEAARRNGSGGQLTRADVQLILRAGHGGEENIFVPLQKWVAADPSLIDHLLDRFNRHCTLHGSQLKASASAPSDGRQALP